MANKKHFKILQRSVASAPKQLGAQEWRQWYEKTEWFQWREAHPRIKPDLSGADLRGMNLIAIDLSFANLSGANLSGISLSDLKGAILSNADLSEADLIGAVLRGADLTDANLTGANLEGAFLHGTNLTGANLSYANFADAEVWNASISGADFTGANLCGADLSDEIGQEELEALNAPRTSESSPLQIAEVAVGDKGGYLGLTICPGKVDADRKWMRDLQCDVDEITEWGASTVVTLIEDHEFGMLCVEKLEREVRQSGMQWIHLPIVDMNVPDHRFEDAWQTQSNEIHRRLDAGERILIHCRGGLGRTGLVAGLILVERGVPPKDAIKQIRSVRPHAIETAAQESYVRNASGKEAHGLV